MARHAFRGRFRRDCITHPSDRARCSGSFGDAAKQKAHLEELLTGVAGGDIRRGQAIFNGTKASCSACHAIGYLGGRVGPDLTSIGQVRRSGCYRDPNERLG